MEFTEFVSKVGERAGATEGVEAERTAAAVLQALCDRLTGDEAHDLLSQLPARLRDLVVVSPPAQPIPIDEFVDRVADELNVDADEARSHIRAVFATLREAVTRGELEDVLGQLEPEYADLLA